MAQPSRINSLANTSPSKKYSKDEGEKRKFGTTRGRDNILCKAVKSQTHDEKKRGFISVFTLRNVVSYEFGATGEVKQKEEMGEGGIETPCHLFLPSREPGISRKEKLSCG